MKEELRPTHSYSGSLKREEAGTKEGEDKVKKKTAEAKPGKA
jgi:hypothetical protein